MRLSILLASFILVSTSSGEPPQVRTEIVTVSLTPPGNVLYYASEKEVLPFSAGMNGLGQPFPYSGPARFILRRDKMDFEPLSAGKKTAPPAASVDLPTGSKRILLVCVPKKDGGLTLIAYDISKSTMANGDYRVFNFSHWELAIILGDKKALVPSSGNRILSHPAWDDEILDLPCHIGTRQPGGDTVTTVYSSLWGHRPIRRNMLFIFDDTHAKGSVQIRRFYDIILPEKQNVASNP